MSTDSDLLQRFVDDESQSAFAELVGRHLNLVYFTALRLTRNPHDANDVSQQVFLKLAGKSRGLTDRPSLAGWLFKTTRYEVAHAARTRQRRLVRETKAHAMNQLLEDGAPATNWESLKPEIDRVLDALSEKDREAILLRYFQNNSYAAIGKSLGVAEDAARIRTQRALEKMRGALSRRGIVSTAGALGLALTASAETVPPAEVLPGILGSVAQMGSSPALTALQIMTMTKSAIVVSTVVCLSVVGLALREHHAAAEIEKQSLEQAHTLARQGDALQGLKTKIQSEQAAISDLKASLASQEKADGAAAKASAALKSGATRQASAGNQRSAIPKATAQDPAFQEALMSRYKAGLASYSGQLFTTLNLTPAQIDAFTSLAAQLNNEALRPDGVTPQDIIAQIKDLLGTDVYAQASQYYQTANLRLVASALAGNLYYTSAPLTGPEADQLTQALASTVNSSGGLATPSMINWEAALPLAQQILSPAQYAAFQTEVAIVSNQPGTLAGIPVLDPGAYASGRYPPVGASAVVGPSTTPKD